MLTSHTQPLASELDGTDPQHSHHRRNAIRAPLTAGAAISKPTWSAYTSQRRIRSTLTAPGHCTALISIPGTVPFPN